MAEPQTTTDRIMTRIKNNPVLSVVIIGGVLVISTASFLNAVDDIHDFFSPQTPTKTKAAESQPTPAAPKEAAAIAEPAKRQLEVGDNIVEFGGDYRLTNLQGYDPAWSNDGRLIVYCSRNYSGAARHGVDLMLSSDGGRTGSPFLSSGSAKFQPLFSFDNRYIAYLSVDKSPRFRWDGSGALWVKPRAGGEPLRVSQGHKSVRFDLNYGLNFDWSPVGNHLAYVELETIQGRIVQSLYLYDVEQQERRLLHRFFKDTGAGSFGGQGDLVRPQWSPDGRRLGVLLGEGGEHIFIHLQIDGSTPVHAKGVTATATFDWISDDTIVFDAGGAGVYRLALYKIGDEQPRYFSRYNYFSTPTVSRATGMISYEGRSKIDEKRWRHEYLFTPSPGAASKSLVMVTRAGFDAPIAQSFTEADDDSRSADVPSRLQLDNTGRRGLIAIDEKIFLVELGLP